jgi:hypothetical protein
MAKFLLSLPDLMLQDLQAYCEGKRYEKSEFIRSIIRDKIYPNDIIDSLKFEKDRHPQKTMEAIVPTPIPELKKQIKTIEDAPNIKPIEEVSQPVGRCEQCHRLQSVKLTEYIDSGTFEHIRQNLCTDCIVKIPQEQRLERPITLNKLAVSDRPNLDNSFRPVPKPIKKKKK